MKAKVFWLIVAMVVGLADVQAQSAAEIGLEGHVYSLRTNKVLPGAIVQVTQFVGQTPATFFSAITANRSGFYAAQFNILLTSAL